MRYLAFGLLVLFCACSSTRTNYVDREFYHYLPKMDTGNVELFIVSDSVIPSSEVNKPGEKASISYLKKVFDDSSSIMRFSGVKYLKKSSPLKIKRYVYDNDSIELKYPLDTNSKFVFVAQFDWVGYQTASGAASYPSGNMGSSSTQWVEFDYSYMLYSKNRVLKIGKRQKGLHQLCFLHLVCQNVDSLYKELESGLPEDLKSEAYSKETLNASMRNLNLE